MWKKVELSNEWSRDDIGLLQRAVPSSHWSKLQPLPRCLVGAAARWLPGSALWWDCWLPVEWWPACNCFVTISPCLKEVLAESTYQKDIQEQGHPFMAFQKGMGPIWIPLMTGELYWHFRGVAICWNESGGLRQWEIISPPQWSVEKYHSLLQARWTPWISPGGFLWEYSLETSGVRGSKHQGFRVAHSSILALPDDYCWKQSVKGESGVGHQHRAEHDGHGGRSQRLPPFHWEPYLDECRPTFEKHN